jgi:uncharacterized membrane protein YkvA (DUF1232 family)
MKPSFQRWRKRAGELKTETYAISLAYKHPRVPWYAKVLAASVVAYALSPIDLIPDFIPVLGVLDDLILVPLGISIVIKMIPADVLTECREKAKLEMRVGKPTNWAAAIIIVIIWLLLAVGAVLLLLRMFRVIN